MCQQQVYKMSRQYLSSYLVSSRNQVRVMTSLFKLDFWNFGVPYDKTYDIFWNSDTILENGYVFKIKFGFSCFSPELYLTFAQM